MKSFKLILEGPPGSGKSSFIEELRLLQLAVPSKMKHFYITNKGCLEHELRIIAKPESSTKEEQKISKKFKEGLNIITAKNILHFGDQTCEVFVDEYNGFLRWCNDIFKSKGDFNFFEKILLVWIEPEFEQRPKWKKFLLEHNFIEEVSETYKAGDMFIQQDGCIRHEYILSTVSRSHLLLVAKDGRSYFGNPSVQVANVNKVTKEEFYNITRGHPSSFTKIEEEQE